MSLGRSQDASQVTRTVLCRVVPAISKVDERSSRPLVVLFSCKVYGVKAVCNSVLLGSSCTFFVLALTCAVGRLGFCRLWRREKGIAVFNSSLPCLQQ